MKLFNGKDIAEWKFEIDDSSNGERKLTKDDFWLVQDGLLICRGGFAHRVLEHPTEFDSDFVFYLQWRWPPNVASGGGVMLHLAKEETKYGQRQGVRVSLDVDEAGGIEYKGCLSAFTPKELVKRTRKSKRKWGNGICCRSFAMARQ